MPLATKVPLKYLFSVVYKDGTWFSQTPEDVSAVDLTRSAYYDVDQERVEQFWLWDGQDSGIGLYLESGEFETSHEGYYGFKFSLPDPGPKPYKLVFWRRHTHNFNADNEELSHVVKYILGYKDADGVEHTILID